jgi:4-hydroxybenzoate polyprenyltransferase
MILSKVIALFKLMRWFHEVAVILPFASLYLVINHFAKLNNVSCHLYWQEFAILCFCIQLLIAVGCVLNDIVDREIDYINKPLTHIINNKISLKEAKAIFVILTLLILICSVYITCYMFWQWAYIVLAVFVTTLLYDFYFKRTPLLGNIVMGILTAFIPLVLLFYAKECITEINNPKLNTLIYLFAFFPMLIIIPRELSLDISDIEGDKACGCKTLPIVIGVKKSKNVVIFFLLLIILLSIILSITHTYLLPASILIDVLLVVYILKFNKINLRIEYIIIGRFLWFIMLLGLVCFTLFTLFDSIPAPKHLARLILKFDL